MNPIETLQREHRVIEQVLDALGNWAHQVVDQNLDGRAELARFAGLTTGSQSLRSAAIHSMRRGSALH